MSASGPVATGSGLISTRMLVGLPTPLALGLRDAASRAGNSAQRLSLRLSFFAQVLRFLVTVQDAERALLQIDRPRKLRALIDRLDRPTEGMWGEAAVALARALQTAPHRPLPPVGAALLDEQSDLYEGLWSLLQIRNRIAHDEHLASLPENVARPLLADSQSGFRRVLLGLEPLCGLRLVVSLGFQESLSGQDRGQVVLHRGEHPELVELQAPGARPPTLQPVLVADDGAILRLFPWMVTSEPTPRHRVLQLKTVPKAGGPQFRSRPGHTRGLAETGADHPDLPEGPAAVWFERFPVARSMQSLDARSVRALTPSLEPETAPRVRDLEPIDLLGRGGTGTVWLVRDPSRGGAQFALKVLHPVLATRTEHARRMEREHATLRQLRLPGVVHVEEVFTDPEHGPCLLMEWVQGPSLADLTRVGPTPRDRVVELGLGLLETLAQVHARGVVHRDLKPSNVLLHEGRPRLIDFGVAWVDDEHRLTVTADVVGTRAYAAPEQLRGGAVTPAADLYACARLLEELLDGRNGERPKGRRPGPLGPVLRRAMRDDPAERYPDAEAMAAALRAAAAAPARRSALDPGELLPGGVRALEVLAEVEPGLFVHRAVDGQGRPSAVVAPGRAGSEAARLMAVVEGAPEPLQRMHLRSRLLRTADGVPYAELWPEAPAASVRQLIAGEGPAAAPPPAAPAPDPDPVAPPTSAPPASEPPPASEDPTAPAADDGPVLRANAGEAVALGLGAIALGALAGHAMSKQARRSTASTGEAPAAPAPSRTGRATRKAAQTATFGSALGSLFGALAKAGANKVHPVAVSRFERCHHAGLALLALEARHGGVVLTAQLWKSAWSTWNGGLLAFASVEPAQTPVVRHVLMSDGEWRAVVAVCQELSALSEAPDDADPRLVGLEVYLHRAFSALAQQNPASSKKKVPFLRVQRGKLQIQRVPASTGWQVVDLRPPAETTDPPP